MMPPLVLYSRSIVYHGAPNILMGFCLKKPIQWLNYRVWYLYQYLFKCNEFGVDWLEWSKQFEARGASEAGGGVPVDIACLAPSVTYPISAVSLHHTSPTCKLQVTAAKPAFTT